MANPSKESKHAHLRFGDAVLAEAASLRIRSENTNVPRPGEGVNGSPGETLLYELCIGPILGDCEPSGFCCRATHADYRSSRTAGSSSSPQTLTYCAFPIVPGPFGPIS